MDTQTQTVSGKEDPRKQIWLEQLKKENPDIEAYFLDFMIDCYLLDPQNTEKIIRQHNKV